MMTVWGLLGFLRPNVVYPHPASLLNDLGLYHMNAFLSNV